MLCHLLRPQVVRCGLQTPKYSSRKSPKMEGPLKDVGQRMQWCHHPLKLDSSRTLLEAEKKSYGDHEIFKGEEKRRCPERYLS